MKFHFFLTISLFLIASVSNSAQAQTVLKFIDAIELKADLVEYSAFSNEADGSIRTKEKTGKVEPVSSGKLTTELCKRVQFKYAQLMDVDIEDIANLTMFSFIEDWWSIRYRYGGSTKNGIDCSALTGLLFCSVYGIVLPRTAREQYKRSQKISREAIKEGDLVFFNTRGGVSHVGVYLSNNYFVHSSVSNGVTISSLDDDYYNKKYIGAGRIQVDN